MSGSLSSMFLLISCTNFLNSSVLPSSMVISALKCNWLFSIYEQDCGNGGVTINGGVANGQDGTSTSNGANGCTVMVLPIIPHIQVIIIWIKSGTKRVEIHSHWYF